MTILAVALSAGLQATAAEPPKEPEEPFAVYVFTEVPGDPEQSDSLGQTTEAIEKRLRDRKKWFRVVESRDEAEISIEVLGQSNERSADETFVRRTDNTSGVDRQMTAFGDVKDSHTLLTRIYVPKGTPFDMEVADGGRRPSDAAKPFARRFEMFVRQNYWTLMEALGK